MSKNMSVNQAITAFKRAQAQDNVGDFELRNLYSALRNDSSFPRTEKQRQVLVKAWGEVNQFEAGDASDLSAQKAAQTAILTRLLNASNPY